MNFKLTWILIALLGLSIYLTAVPIGLAKDFTSSYKLPNYSDGTLPYLLTVNVSSSLNEYYQDQNHRAGFDSDFEKFVTPHAVKPIADALRKLYSNDEDFANSVLMIVHQISYEETVQEFYPVETLARKSGDCDMFSLLASSIMKAGGLDVVLLHYVSEEHMNVGVQLSHKPQHARQNIFSVTTSNVTYYIAECTSTNWQDGWRLGECPPDLQKASPKAITLEAVEQSSPEQVSVSVAKLDQSTVQLSIDPVINVEKGLITFHGKLSPNLPNENVTLYTSLDGSNWIEFSTITTQLNGEFSYDWKSVGVGFVNFRAAWFGNDKFAAATSGNKFTVIMPFYLAVSLIAAVVAVIVCMSVVAAKRISRRKISHSPKMATNGVQADI